MLCVHLPYWSLSKCPPSLSPLPPLPLREGGREREGWGAQNQANAGRKGGLPFQTSVHISCGGNMDTPCVIGACSEFKTTSQVISRYDLGSLVIARQLALLLSRN